MRNCSESPVQQKMKRQTTDPIRSATMRAVKSKNTAPELEVRRFVHSLGFRFRLHRSDLPGSPDLAFPKLKIALFVDGCFWHSHSCARGARKPKSNAEYWHSKIMRNVERDRENGEKLHSLGWKVLRLWECDLQQHPEATRRRIAMFLQNASR